AASYPLALHRDVDMSKHASISSETIIFEYRLEKTNLQFKKHLRPLHFLSTETIELWITSFRNAADLCRWDDASAFEVLMNLLPVNLQKEIQEEGTVDKALDHLLKLAFPVSDALFYLKSLEKMSQHNYALIQDYLGAIEQNVSYVAICNSWNKSSIRARVEETFLKGLSYETQMELAKQDKHTMSDILNYIQRVEKRIASFANGRAEGRSNNDKKQSSSKWCTLHRTNLHDNTECRAQIAKTNEKSHYKSAKNLIIKEPEIQDPSLEFTGTIFGKSAKILFDTGATDNYISNLLVPSSVKLETTDTLQVEFGNQQMGSIAGRVQTQLTFENIPSTQYKVSFKVLDDLKDDLVVLGREFMNKNKVRIDFSRYILQIDHDYLHLDNSIMLKEEVETQQMLTDNLFLISQLKNDANKLFDSYLLSKPTEFFGKITDEFFEIQVTSPQPIIKKPYNIPLKLREAFSNEIQRLLNLGIIQPSNAQYGSPCFPLVKRSGEIRLVVDYRALNKITIPSAYPFPSLFEQLRGLPSYKFYTKFDLKHGYHQIPIHPACTHYTGFVTPFGHYEYTRVPFGLTNAPREFQKIIANIFQDLPYVHAFLDDILIGSFTEADHICNIKTVLTRFKDRNLQVNIEKSDIAVEEVTFLGHKICHKGIRPDCARISALNDLKTPSTKKDIQRVVGLINWFRPFVCGLSSRIHAITDKLKEKEFKWTSEDAQTICTIIQEVQKETLLYHPNLTEPFELVVDASANALGAILYQKGNLIGYYSHKLANSELNYTVTEKEFYAILKSVINFKDFLYGAQIVIHTDHNNNTFENSQNSTRISRWKAILQDYDINLTFIRGCKNQGADTLSRLHLIKTSNLEKDKRATLSTEETKILLEKVHIQLMHVGRETLYNTLSLYYKFVSGKKLIDEMLKSCKICCTRKPNPKQYGVLRGNLISDKPMENISMDLYGPVNAEEMIQRGKDKTCYLLTIIDRFSRMAEVVPLGSPSSEDIIAKIKDNWFTKFPIPKTILTDQGTQFTGRNFKKFTESLNIKHIQTLPYNPTCNSISERINQTIARGLRCSPGTSIKDVCAQISFALQHSYHSSLGVSPHELYFKFSIFDREKTSLDITHTSILERQHSRAQRDLDTRNKGRIITTTFKEGMMVWKRVAIRGKYDDFFEGPYKITQVLGSGNSFVLESAQKITVANIKQIIPCASKEGETVAA
ncbi:hypothetical protein ENBRE01_3199, partial [Enteropsectra breve]